MRHVLPAFLLVAGCAMTSPHSDRDARALADAERAFAAQSMRTDMGSAFLANFSERGVLVAAGWTDARTAFAGKPPPPVDLDWAPSHVEVAASGDLGLSTGPWIRRSRTKPDAPAAHGHFVSVWRRSAEGRWQVEVDLGIPHPQAFAKPLEAEIVAPSAAPWANESFEEAESRFEEASARDGVRAAYAAHALPRFMLYRDGNAPIHGRQAALSSAALADARIVWDAAATAVSRANDFAYVRGSYAEAQAPGKLGGYFLRVWRREGEGWGVVLEVTSPAR